MTQIITALSEVSEHYEALFVDLWGCVHNGVRALPEAVLALQTYRKKGGKVVLVTNSPRPRAGVKKQLLNFGVPNDAWDTIATSGDSARVAMFNGIIGDRLYLIGQPGEERFFKPIRVIKNPISISMVPLSEATGIVCTGPQDPMSDPNILRPQFLLAKQMGLKLLCANPDIVVDRGHIREWCAGALAKVYTEIGGESLYFGKPHAPIYDLARRRLADLGTDIPDCSILAIGDGLVTDIAGAIGENFDSLFITGGLAAAETRTAKDPDKDLLIEYLKKEKSCPTFSIGHLR